ncbi:MAG TPA: hypothetical protein VHZ55_19475 [Bryobacteraceae bacterium]|jgi:hypothetical protein|nr:hypothetical protein [Bryobacteraceae bacterium]
MPDIRLSRCSIIVRMDAHTYYAESTARNQDDELAYRVTRSGRSIWQDSHTLLVFSKRSPWGLAKRLLGYGFWRVYTMRKHRTVVRLRHLAFPAEFAGTAPGMSVLSNT